MRGLNISILNRLRFILMINVQNRFFFFTFVPYILILLKFYSYTN